MQNKSIKKLRQGDREYIVTKELHDDLSISYGFQDEKGDSKMRIYTLFPGIKIIHHDVHTDKSFLGTAKKGNVIEIHHCREGRMEQPLDKGYFYLMPGDLAVDIVNRDTKEFVFPLRHYHGITISINTDVAPACFSCFLKDVSIQPTKIAEKLCGEERCFVIRSKDYIEHLFSEMYSVPCENKEGYYKIKVLELLLVLSGIKPGENNLSTHTLSGAQVDLAKRAAGFMTENMDNKITVQGLAKEFHVSVTHLQNAFKGVYGVPVFSYMRIHKMNSAALTLAKTDETVMDVANRYGYDNASKFAAAFKEVMGETPVEYRKAHRLI